MKVTQNLPSGPEPLVFERSEGTYNQRIQKAFDCLTGNKSALIVINYEDMSLTPNEIQESQRNQTFNTLLSGNDKSIRNLMVAIEAIKANRLAYPQLAN